MEIPKEKILEMLRERGADDKVQQAEQELPDQVDPEQHKDQLEKLGIDPQDLLGGIGGKLGLLEPPRRLAPRYGKPHRPGSARPVQDAGQPPGRPGGAGKGWALRMR